MKYSHQIRDRYICEKCGKETSWFTMDIVGESNGIAGAAPAAVEGYLACDELRAKLRSLKKFADGDNYGLLDEGAACPFCRTRQSWLPIHDVTQLTLEARAVINVLAFLVLGLIVGLITFLLADGIFDIRWNGPVYAIPAITVGIPLLFTGAGAYLAVRSYQRKTAENQKQLAEANVRNKPEIDWCGAEVLFKDRNGKE